MKKIIRLLPHATLILSLMVLTFFVIDRFNEYMAFMSSELSKWVIAGLALCALLSAIPPHPGGPGGAPPQEAPSFRAGGLNPPEGRCFRPCRMAAPLAGARLRFAGGGAVFLLDFSRAQGII